MSLKFGFFKRVRWYLPVFVLATVYAAGQSPFSHPAITTSFADTAKKPADIDGLDLDPKMFRPLLSVPRNQQGALLLTQGAYSATVRSYCLHAGTHAPSAGDGYLYAPLKGSMADIVQAILRESAAHPEILQQDIQVLIWTVETETKLSNYPPHILEVAHKLLSPKQLLKLQGGVVGLIPQGVLEQAESDLGPEAQELIRSADHLKTLLESGSSTFAEIERVAVLAEQKPTVSVKRGRWTLHPGGFYVRYYPDGYTRTRIDVLVPDKKTKAGLVRTPLLINASFEMQDGGADSGPVAYDPSGDVAVPADTNQQRLGMSMLPSPVNVGRGEYEWVTVTQEGDRGGHRCTQVSGIFDKYSIGYSKTCVVEVCVPFSDYQGKVSTTTANDDVSVYGTAAGQRTQQLLNADLEPGDICGTWKNIFNQYLNTAIPGSTVSSPGTVKMQK